MARSELRRPGAPSASRKEAAGSNLSSWTDEPLPDDDHGGYTFLSPLLPKLDRTHFHRAASGRALASWQPRHQLPTKVSSI
jgi:hypothetical protein